MEDGPPEQLYNEQLQDDVYLQEGLRNAAAQLLAGSNGVLAPVAPPHNGNHRLASRTPSPPPQDCFHPELTKLGRLVRPLPLQDLSTWQRHLTKLDHDKAPSGLTGQSRLSLPTSFGQTPREEAVFDDEALPVRRTFIHYGLDGDCFQQQLQEERRSRLVGSTSAPNILMRHCFGLKVSPKVLAHMRNECKPCAYFNSKQDGCRQGADCRFCHECNGKEIKRRKREKMRALRKLAKDE
jgi:hypothetical protein